MDSEASMEKMGKIIKEFISNSELKSHLQYKEIEVIYPGNREQEISVSGRVPKDKSLNLDEFRENLYEVLNEEVDKNLAGQFISQEFNVEVGICEGEKFNGLDVFDMQGNKFKIQHQTGQVLMVDFWATWCGYCQEPMQENIDMMSKNDILKNKNILVVGISCDEKSPDWKAHVNQRNWDVIPQYVKSDIRKICGIKGIPCIAIVNKQGVIAYIGHPGSINVEQTLLNLSEDKSVVKSQEENSEQNSFWKNLDTQSKMDLVAEANFAIKDAGIINANFCVTTKSSLDSEGNSVVQKISPVFYGEVTQFEYDTLQTVAISLQTTYNFDGFVFNVKVIQIGADEDF